MYESMECGISPLMVIPRTTQDIEEEMRRKEVESESQGTRTQAEALQMKKADTRGLPRNRYEIKEMLAIFAALWWVLFGNVGPLYDQVYKSWSVLNQPFIKAVKSKKLRIRCAHLTWQVLEGKLLFFD